MHYYSDSRIVSQLEHNQNKLVTQQNKKSEQKLTHSLCNY